MSEDSLLQEENKTHQQLASCQCCTQVKEPAGGSKGFLIAADQTLSDLAGGGNYLNPSKTEMCPPEMRYVGISQAGLNAEYKVFYGLRDSKIPMYVFHGLKSLKSNNELADFIIVTDRIVISLEVKAFELNQKPEQKDIGMFEEVLKKSFQQQARFRQEVKKFLDDHDCRVTNDHEMPVHTFTLFPLAKNRDHHLEHITKDFDDKLKKDHLLFGDEYIEKLEGLMRENTICNEEKEFQLRTLLAWFYGTYSYEELASDRRERGVFHAVSRLINEENRRTRKDVGGVFLTPKQLQILNCKEMYLGIVGFPGTGKTYCLLAKLVMDVSEKLSKKKKQDKQKSESQLAGDGKTDEKFLIIHPLKTTLQSLENIFWRALESRISKKEHLNKAREMVEFLTEEDLWSKYESLKKNECQLRVFFDDYPNTEECASLLRGLEQKIDFLWYTCYSKVTFFDPNHRPFKALKVEGDFIFDRDKYAILEDTVRFTAHIHCVAETIYRHLPTYVNFRSAPEWKRLIGPRKTTSRNYVCGTRVVGDQVKFIPVTDEDAYETIKQELNTQMEKYQPYNVLIVVESGKHQQKLRWFLDDDKYKEITVRGPFDILGLEMECVLVFVDFRLFDEIEKEVNNVGIHILLHAITRATSQLIVVYDESLILFYDSDESEISEEGFSKADLDEQQSHLDRPGYEIPNRISTLGDFFKLMVGRTPSIYSSTKTKAQESVFKEIEPLNIADLLEDKFLFKDFCVELHKMQKPCVTEEEKRNGLAACCCLSCTDRVLNAVLIPKDPSKSFLLLKRACYFQLLTEEIESCKFKMEKEIQKSIDVFMKIQERVNYLLGILLRWMKNIEKEPGIMTGVFSYSCLQYSQLTGMLENTVMDRRDLEDTRKHAQIHLSGDTLKAWHDKIRETVRNNILDFWLKGYDKKVEKYLSNRKETKETLSLCLEIVELYCIFEKANELRKHDWRTILAVEDICNDFRQIKI